jgi:hypothetical protein
MPKVAVEEEVESPSIQAEEKPMQPPKSNPEETPLTRNSFLYSSLLCLSFSMYVLYY